MSRTDTTQKQTLDMSPMFRYLHNEMAAGILRGMQRCGSHITPTTRWYCVQTHQSAEFTAFLELERQGFVVHLPLFCDRTRAPNRAGVRPVAPKPPPILPLFSGYLFVAFDIAADQWRRIASTRGVRRIFGATPERPLPVPDGVVERLMQRSGPDGYADPDKPRKKGAMPLIEVGSQVELLDGPFAGFTGLCEMSSDQRVRVLVEIMGRRAPVEMKRADVALVA